MSLPDARYYAHFKHVKAAIFEVVRVHAAAASSLLLSSDAGPVLGARNAVKLMPTERQLEALGLADVLAAIRDVHGGMVVVARRLQLRVQGPGTRSMLDRANSQSTQE